MADAVNKGAVVDYTSGSATTAGDVVEIQDSVTDGYIGVASLDIEANVVGELNVEGVFDFPAKNGDAIVLGSIVYWDEAVPEITITAGANNLAGRAVQAITASNTVRVKINVR